MTTMRSSRKRRRLNNDEIEESFVDEEKKSKSIVELILDSEIDDILGDETNVETLDKLSKKLQLLHEEVKQQEMKAISFENVQNPMDSTETKSKLEKFIHCTKSDVMNGDSECDIGDNYFHITSYGYFEFGLNKTSIHFNASIGDQEGDTRRQVSLNANGNELWRVEIEENVDPKININLDAVKQFVESSGIKGIGIKPQKNKNNKNKDEDVCHGYYAFLNDLTEICIELIENQNGETIYGDLDPEFELYSVFEQGKIDELNLS